MAVARAGSSATSLMGARRGVAPSGLLVGMFSGLVMISPYDTSGCPAASRCVVCGVDVHGRRRAVECFLGVFCADLCGACFRAQRLPRMDRHAALEATSGHEQHLGISRDELLAACRASWLPHRGVRAEACDGERFVRAREAFSRRPRVGRGAMSAVRSDPSEGLRV
jgi:hypothetical protein